MAATPRKCKLEARQKITREYRLGRRDAALSHHGPNVVFEKEGLPNAARHRASNMDVHEGRKDEMFSGRNDESTRNEDGKLGLERGAAAQLPLI